MMYSAENTPGTVIELQARPVLTIRGSSVTMQAGLMTAEAPLEQCVIEAERIPLRVGDDIEVHDFIRLHVGCAYCVIGVAERATLRELGIPARTKPECEVRTVPPVGEAGTPILSKAGVIVIVGRDYGAFVSVGPMSAVGRFDELHLIASGEPKTFALCLRDVLCGIDSDDAAQLRQLGVPVLHGGAMN